MDGVCQGLDSNPDSQALSECSWELHEMILPNKHDSQHSSQKILPKEAWPRIINFIKKQNDLPKITQQYNQYLNQGFVNMNDTYYLWIDYQVPGTELSYLRTTQPSKLFYFLYR